MCGIIGIVSKNQVVDRLIDGLECLEYRGYDSAGILLCNNSESQLTKISGKVNSLSKILENKQQISTHLGIGHTRWATHGMPNDTNAHPHHSNSGKLYIVDNGIGKGTLIKLTRAGEVIPYILEVLKKVPVLL